MKDARHRPVSGAEQSMLDELDTIGVASILTAEQLADLDAVEHPPLPAVTLREIARQTIERLRAENRRNGHQARARRQIDEHRRGEGQEQYNASRREAFARKVMAEEQRLVRDYAMPDSPEKLDKRRDQNMKAQQAKRNSRTPEQVAAHRARDAARKRAARKPKTAT